MREPCFERLTFLLDESVSQDPVIPLLVLRRYDQSCYKNMCSTMFKATLFVIPKTRTQPKLCLTKE